MFIVNFITSNFVEILAIAGSINVVAFAVAKLTPNKTDDRWVQRCQSFLDFLALNNTKSQRS